MFFYIFRLKFDFGKRLTFWNDKKPLNASEVDLQKHFEKFGLVDHISVAKDKNGGEGHKGFAFVTFVDKQVEHWSLFILIQYFF